MVVRIDQRPIPTMNTFTLRPHPATPCSFIESLVARVERQAGGMYCSYELRGAIERLAIPATDPAPARVNELWRHTCFEIFLQADGDAAYDEFNFSPSGNWAAYRFERYRTGMVELELGTAPRIVSRNDSNRLVLEASVAGSECDRPRMALSTVLKDQDGNTYYWALRHPPGRPDFHHDAGFAAILAKP